MIKYTFEVYNLIRLTYTYINESITTTKTDNKSMTPKSFRYA
jgi:hypothetical protein